MISHNPQFIITDSLAAARKEIQAIGSDPKSIDIMAPKAVFKIIKLKQVELRDAIIIKQDMLSLGGEVAIPRDAFKLEKKPADILIMGTILQHRKLSEKLQRHYPRIQEIAKELVVFIDKIT
jgi:hypothetical protein